MTVIIHRRDPQNAGDMASCPKSYFPWLKDAYVMDIPNLNHRTARSLEGEDVIIGGGGMFYLPFASHLRSLIGVNLKSLTLWGIGRNNHDEHGLILDQDLCDPILSDLMDKADLVGLRDCRVEPSWVPCPSIHYATDLWEKERVGEGVLAYQHREDRFAFPIEAEWTSIKSQGPLNPLLRRISEAEVVMSSSYHGCLWAAWMGKRVVAVDGFSQKFRTGLPEEVVQASSAELFDLDLDSIKPVPRSFSQQSRTRGLHFAAKVRDILHRLE